MCVLICLLSRDGLSNALPHTSHGKRALSLRVGLAFGVVLGIMTVESIISPVLLAPDDINDSPETDLCSSSAPDGGLIGKRTRDNNDMERSSGESKLNEATSNF